MAKIIEIKGIGGSLVDPSSNTNDVITDKTTYYNNSTPKYRKRTEKEMVKLDTPILFSQTSNMLHVFFGERPVSTNRASDRKRLKWIDDITKTGIYKIDNSYCYKDSKDNIKYSNYLTFSKKSMWNCTAKIKDFYANGTRVIVGDINWDGLYKKYYFYDKDKYYRIINFFEKTANLPIETIKKKYTLADFIYSFRDDKIIKKEFIDFFKKEKVSAFINIINDIHKDGVVSASAFNLFIDGNLNAKNIVHGIMKKIPIDCTFYFRIDNESLLIKLYNGSHYSKFLDGGIAKITNIYDDFSFSFLEKESEGFKKIYNSEKYES